MQRQRALVTVMVLASALAITGCASTTRTASFGPLPGGVSLLTLVVTEDLDVVRKECASIAAHGQVLGCQTSTPIFNVGPAPVRAVKIVRYAETAPSPVTFEIDAHELCHAVAALQLVEDPCHIGNGGALQSHDRWTGSGIVR